MFHAMQSVDSVFSYDSHLGVIYILSLVDVSMTHDCES